MRTIVEVQSPETGIHPEAVLDDPKYEIELETPFECNQFLGVLRAHYESSADSGEAAADRITIIDDHLLQCDPKDKESHSSFFISSDEANILAFLLNQRAVDKGVQRLSVALAASQRLGINYRHIAPLLQIPETRSAYKGLQVMVFAPDIGKVALKIVK